MAASRTAPGRTPHSVHVYYLRAGDARLPGRLPRRNGARRRHPVDQEGHGPPGRRGTPRGARLLQHATVDDSDHQSPMADVPDPETLPSVQEQLATTPTNSRPLGRAAALRPALRRPAATAGAGPADAVAADPIVVAANRIRAGRPGTAQLPTDVSVSGHHDARDGSRHAAGDAQTTFNALIDHALWFHRPIDFTDWVLSDQVSPSGVRWQGTGERARCTTARANWCASRTQELYFGRQVVRGERHRVDLVTCAKLNCQRSTMWKPSRSGT